MGKIFVVLSILSLTVPILGEQYDWQIRNSYKSKLENLKKHCTLDSRPSDLTRCKQLLKRVKKNMTKVEPKNQKVKNFVLVKEYVAKVDAKISTWENSIKSEKDAKADKRKISDEFKKLYRPHDTILGSVWGMKTNPKKYIQTKPFLLLKDIEKAEKMEKDLLEGCKAGKYNNVSSFAKKGSYRDPASICDVAQNWKKYFVKYFERVMKQVVDTQLKMVKAHIKNLKEKGELYGSDIKRLKEPKKYYDDLLNNYKDIYKKLGMGQPKDLFKETITCAKKYKKVLKNSSRKNRWDKKAKYKNGSVYKAFKRAVKAHKFKLYKVGLTHPNWSIKKNKYGIPLSKIRSGYVLVKNPKEKFCRIYYLTAKSIYEGGKKGYTVPTTSFSKSDGFTVSRCK